MKQSSDDIVLLEGDNELNVQMVPKVPPILDGEILEVTWWDGASWHSFADPLPEYTNIIHRFRVKNTGNTLGTFKVGYRYWSGYPPPGQWRWHYSPSFDIEPGTEGDVDWVLNTSAPGTTTITFYLFADDTEVDSIAVTIIVV